MKTIIDLVLMLFDSKTTPTKCDVVVKNQNRRPNSKYTNQVTQDAKKMQNIMNYQKLLNNPVFVNIFVLIVQNYVKTTNTIIELNVQNIKLHDIINGLFYVYVYVLLPVLYREKTINIISGSGLSSNYKSFQFPDCVPIVREYFKKHKESTLKGLSFWRNIFIRLDVTQLKQSLLSFLKYLRKLRTSSDENNRYIKIPLKHLDAAKQKLNNNISYYEFLQNNDLTMLNTRKPSLVNKTFTTLLAATPVKLVNWFLNATYTELNIKERAFKRNNVLYIPNIFNEHVIRLTPNGVSVYKQFANYIYLLIIYTAQFVYNTTFYTSFQSWKSFYSTLVKENIIPNGNIVEHIESFFLVYFGMNASNSKNSAKHLINFDMVALYVKLVFSILKPLNKSNTMDNTTKCLCSFYHNFKMDKNIKNSRIDHLVLFVKHMVEHFSTFSVSYNVTLPNNKNKNNIDKIIKINENKTAFVSILSVYLTVINILRVIKNNKVTFESGFLTTNNVNKKVHLISMYDNNEIVKALKEFIIIQNLQVSDDLKRSYRNHLEKVILTKGLNIPSKMIPSLHIAKSVVIPVAKQLPKIIRPIAKVTKPVLNITDSLAKRISIPAKLLKKTTT